MSETREKREDGHYEWGCKEQLKDECHLKSFTLNHPRPDLLASSQWCHPNLYVFWRLFWAIYHVGWIIYDWVQNARYIPRPATWPIYLTSWAFSLLTINTVILAIVQIYVTCSRPKYRQGEKTPWYLKLSWLSYTVATDAALMITLLFFFFLFDGTDSLTLISGIEHAGNTAYVLIDLFVTAMPLRLLHVVYSMIYGATFVIFSAIYWAAGGVNLFGEPYIYEAMDWSQPKKTLPLTFGTVFIAVPVVHFVSWLLHLLRIGLARCCCKDGQNSRIQSTLNTA